MASIGTVAAKRLDDLVYAYMGEHAGFDTSLFGAYGALKASVVDAADGSGMTEAEAISWVDGIFADWSTHLVNGEFSSDYDVKLPGVSPSPQGSTTVVTTVPVEAPVVKEGPVAVVAPEVIPAPVSVDVPSPAPVVAPSPVVSVSTPVAAPLYVTEEMRDDFRKQAKKMLVAPWMKHASGSLMVSAMSQLAVYNSVDSALGWFREYLDTLQRVGIAHGDIDPVTLDTPKVVKEKEAVVKPSPRSIEKLLDRSWIGDGMKRVYRSLYQTYLSEDPDGAYHRLSALLDALEKAGRAHGDIGGGA